MAYTANTPQSTDRVSDTQSPILNNFLNIPTLIAVNHVGFDGSADEGKHKHISFPEQGSTPPAAANEVNLFSRESPYTTTTALAIVSEGSSTVTEFTSRGSADPYWTYLPSGILLMWGTVNGTGDVQKIINTTPRPTVILSLMATPMATPAGTDIDFAVRVVDWSITAPQVELNFYASKRTTTGAAINAKDISWFLIGI